MFEVLALSPTGRLHVISTREEEGGKQSIPNHKVVAAFISSQAEGLLALAAASNIESWSPPLLYWREFISQYITRLCHQVPTGFFEPIAVPLEEALVELVLNIPPMLGAEYCSSDSLRDIWLDFDVWVHSEVDKIGEGIGGFLSQYLPLWHQVGRVCFHLAENKQDSAYPFAFLATYAPSLGKNARIQYQALSKALQEYAGEQNKQALVHLLRPIHEASKRCEWVDELVASGDIYHPLAWTPQDAYDLLKSAPSLEESGIVVRLPDWWKKRPRPRVQVSIGNTKQKAFGADAMLDFQIDVAIEGAALTDEELAAVFAADDGLIFIKGQWIEVDREKLTEALNHWESLQEEVDEEGLSFIEGMRLLSGTKHDLSGDEGLDEQNQSWACVEAGSWLREILAQLRQPASLALNQLGKSLHTTLRPYQEVGVSWLRFLTDLGLGACLADDMGLGKTIQVIALLLIERKQRSKRKYPSILVLPASLLSNWKAELKRFAPVLKPLYIHSSELSCNELEKIAQSPTKYFDGVDIVLTSYGMLLRQPWLKEQIWNLVVLDEAQAIKNPTTRQSKAVKGLSGRARIALTGTPVENRLGDLWSLFDFLSPGLLGSTTHFKKFIKNLEKREHAPYAPLRRLVQPYILRRLKTDKKVISDLPDKTEVTAWCGLTKEQATLYARAVRELSMVLEGESGIKRRGLVLSFLMRFKQICNHPSQLLEDGEYNSTHSGKFVRLGEICEEIAGRQEKVLIFTQFRRITEPLADFLAGIFGRPGLVLHGGTPVRQRKKLVDSFQNEDGPPFFILSLKAGGTGFNLTAASHVVHFDRWWNPAVENQATDRAFRIGQKKKVLVHKFVCRGTVEEKIDKMIAEKSQLAGDVLSAGGEAMLTELDDSALIDLVSLDVTKAKF